MPDINQMPLYILIIYRGFFVFQALHFLHNLKFKLRILFYGYSNLHSAGPMTRKCESDLSFYWTHINGGSYICYKSIPYSLLLALLYVKPVRASNYSFVNIKADLSYGLYYI